MISVLAVTSGIAFILSFVIKEDLKRHRYEEKKKNKQQHLKKISAATDAEETGAYRSDENATSSSGSYQGVQGN